jgi:predicted nucleic acid-binding protein
VALILDTGPIYASADRRDAYHAACKALIDHTPETLVIPAPVLVEADYLFRRWLHPGMSLRLLDDILGGAFEIEALEPPDYARIRDICSRYEDSDIGFVDASVVALAERLGEDKIATLDHRHFRIIRPRHVDAFRLLPE